jgi:hypothetical protein
VLADTSASGTIRGSLLSLPDSGPLADAIVRVESPRAGAIVDSTGHFQLSGLPSGRIVVQFRRIGYYSADVPIDLPNGHGVLIHGALEHDCSVDLSRSWVSPRPPPNLRLQLSGAAK